ncbi:MAG: arsenite methyltransferase [Candidatus Aminicenantes bacterium]|nr:arsenite methyltransferase [Candidatus Aminicenantes bacterium]
MSKDRKKVVRDEYAAIAREERSCCCGRPSSVRKAGYDATQLRSIPGEADLGLGCGNPTALTGLRPGETVIDLGSGAGMDCFLAARQVGPCGRVIGVDMTPEMLDRARRVAAENSFANVEFRLGEIENLPVADNTADVVISNCVINLSTDKGRVFREIFRALKPSGRMIVSDMVRLRELPGLLRDHDTAYASCISGAVLRDEYLARARAAGFEGIEVLSESPYSREMLTEKLESIGLPASALDDRGPYLASITIRARKPAIAGPCCCE